MAGTRAGGHKAHAAVLAAYGFALIQEWGRRGGRISRGGGFVVGSQKTIEAARKGAVASLKTRTGK